MNVHVQCNHCGAFVIIPAGADADAALTCGCCPLDHHHGEAANETGAPCRPVTITLLPGSVPVSLG